MRRRAAIAAVLLAGCIEAPGEAAPRPCGDCPEGKVCRGESCVSFACTLDDECDVAERCFQGSCCRPLVCVDEGTGCGALVSCGLDGFCGCPEGMICPSPGSACVVGPCDESCDNLRRCGPDVRLCNGEKLCNECPGGIACPLSGECACGDVELPSDCTASDDPCGARDAGACTVCACPEGLVCGDEGRCEPFATVDCARPVRRCGPVEGVDCGGCEGGLVCDELAQTCRPTSSPTCWRWDGEVREPGAPEIWALAAPREVMLGADRWLYFSRTTRSPFLELARALLDARGEPDWASLEILSGLDVPYLDGWTFSAPAFSLDGREVYVSLDKPHPTVDEGDVSDAEIYQAAILTPRAERPTFSSSRLVKSLDRPQQPPPLAWPTDVSGPTPLPDGRSLLYFDSAANQLQGALRISVRASGRPDDLAWGGGRSLVLSGESETARFGPGGLTPDLGWIIGLWQPDPQTFSVPARLRLVRVGESWELVGPHELLEMRGDPGLEYKAISISPGNERLWVENRVATGTFLTRYVPCD